MTIGANITKTYTSDALATDGDGFGVGDYWEDGTGKCYKFVQYDTGAGGVAAVIGEVAYYYLAGGYKNHIVTEDLSDSVNLGAGVMQSAPADGEFCWIQIKGPATLTIALTAGSDGNALTAVGATDGTLDVSAAVTNAVVAFADDISAQEIVCCFPR